MALSPLTSALAICVLLSGACIPCPASLLQHTFPGCSSILLKDTKQVDAQHRKDQVRGGEWKGGRKVPWLMQVMTSKLLTRFTFCKMNYDKNIFSLLLKWIVSIWESPIRASMKLQNVYYTQGAIYRGFVAITQLCGWRRLFTMQIGKTSKS